MKPDTKTKTNRVNKHARQNMKSLISLHVGWKIFSNKFINTLFCSIFAVLTLYTAPVCSVLKIYNKMKLGSFAIIDVKFLTKLRTKGCMRDGLITRRLDYHAIFFFRTYILEYNFIIFSIHSLLVS